MFYVSAYLTCITKCHPLSYKCLRCLASVCFFSVIAPAFFTILYSMEWGKTKANEWLTTFVLSFFQSVIVVQPIKVRRERHG